MSARVPMFSVVIPTYRGERHLPACLASLREQTRQDFEVVLVANGAGAETFDIIEAEYPEARVVVIERAAGFARPVNLGCRLSRAPWLFLLNDDTVLAPDCLERLAEGVEEHPEADFFAPLMLCHDRPETVDSAGHCLCPTGTVWNEGAEHPAESCTLSRTVFGVCAGAAVYRRAAVEALGGFDEDFRMVCEDVDLDFRLQLHRRSGWFLPAARVLHKGTQTIGQRSPLLMQWYERNRICYLIKDIPPAMWRRHGRLILLNLWKSTSWRIRQGYLWPLIKAHCCVARVGWRMLPKRLAMMPALVDGGRDLVHWLRLDGLQPSDGEVLAQTRGELKQGRAVQAARYLGRNLVPGVLALGLLTPAYTVLAARYGLDVWWQATHRAAQPIAPSPA